MGEPKSSSDNKLKPSSKYSDENQAPLKGKNNNASSNLKPRSIWGSNIVKGFSADKKTRSQQGTKKTMADKKTMVVGYSTSLSLYGYRIRIDFSCICLI